MALRRKSNIIRPVPQQAIQSHAPGPGLNPVRRFAVRPETPLRSFLRGAHAISFARLVRLFSGLLGVEAAAHRALQAMRLTLDGKPLLNTG
jgi:hypothetical protein